MAYRWLAALVLTVHLGFVLFVVFGGLLALRRRGWMWIHLPAALWGAWIEFSGGVCPLTPLEISLRRRAGLEGYDGGFIEHYLLAALYPAGLTRGTQVVMGVMVLAINAAVYVAVLRRFRRSRAKARGSERR